MADDVVRREDGVLAGSALTMIEAVRNLVAVGVRSSGRSRPRPRFPRALSATRGLGRLEVADARSSSCSTTPRGRPPGLSAESRVSPADAAAAPAVGGEPGSRFQAEILEQPAALLDLL